MRAALDRIGEATVTRWGLEVIRWTMSAVVLSLSVALTAGCSGRQPSESQPQSESQQTVKTPTRTEFRQRLVERELITPEEAACVTAYVFDENPPDVIGQLYGDGLKYVSMAHWNSYAHSMIACTFADDLDVTRVETGGAAGG